MKQVVYLANHPNLIQPVAELGLHTFAHFNPGQTLEMRIEKITHYLNTDQLPMTLVGLDNNQVIGTTTLNTEDLETYTQVSPWLASVVVAPTMRNRGVGTWLVEETMKKAIQLGVPTWYLYTSDKETFYARMGWRTIDTTVYQNVPGVIMQYDAPRKK